MRTYLTLIIAAILLSFSTAYFALNLQNDYLADPDEVNEIKNLEIEFQKAHKSLIEIDLSSMYPTRGYFELLQPTGHPFNQVPKFSKECGKDKSRMTKGETNKVEIWESFRCRENLKLPEYFFEYSPYIHESGESYAYLAFSSGLAPFNDVGWVKKNLNFFHISELHRLPPESLDERFKILSILDQLQLESLIKGNTSLLTNDYYITKKEQKSGHLYQVFSLLDLERFLNKKPYYVKSIKIGEKCFYPNGSVCWQKDSSSLLKTLRPSSILIFISSVFILIIVSLILYSRIKLQNKEEERKKHALRVLTHELRTPIANLLLQIEEINKKSDLVNPIVLEELLKMEGEVYRLKRLAEKSSSYLHSNNDKGLITFDYKEIASINDMVVSILESYKKYQLIFEPLKNDQSILIDIYWFSICLKNLIENAIHHGALPVKIISRIDGEYFRIDVIDAGEFNLKKKNQINSGLGLGLSLVEKIMIEMKGELLSSTSPTMFSLLIRNK